MDGKHQDRTNNMKQESQNRGLSDLVKLYLCHEENPFVDPA